MAILSLETKQDELVTSLRREHLLQSFIGNHPAFTTLVERLRTIAAKKIAVLLIGETGTGKGRCAEFIHQYGDRHHHAFITYNCGAGPESLFEDQLFGHARGAFTNADKERAGLIEESHRGILFLDEINSLNPSAQVKLNHFLETGCFRRIGETQLRYSDVRIIAAANSDLKKEAHGGRFRQDLYYRLAEYELYLPPLRARREDIIPLANYFLAKNAHLGRDDKAQFSEETLQSLLEYDWPGNVRELENFIKRAIIESQEGALDKPPLFPVSSGIKSNEPDALQGLTWKNAKKRVVASFEKQYLENLLQRYHGKVTTCARHAGMHSPDFWKLLRKYHIDAHHFLPKQS